MAHTPLKMSISEAHAEVKHGWNQAYSPEAIAHAVRSLNSEPLGYRINILISRLCFRGIYFPQMGPLSWLKVLSENQQTITDLVKEGFRNWISGSFARPARVANVRPALEAHGSD